MRFFAAATLVWLLSSATNCHALDVFTSEDGQVDIDYDTNEISVSEVDGQWWPSVAMIPSPPQESQVVLEFDLSPYDISTISSAELIFYLGGTNDGFSSVRLDTWFYEGNGVVDITDFDAGDELVGTFEWDSPTGDFERVDEFVSFDITSNIQNLSSDFATFNLRLSGDFPDYGGNVFNPDNPFRFLGVAANENDENGGIFRPRISLTTVPEPGTGCVTAVLIAICIARRRRVS